MAWRLDPFLLSFLDSIEQEFASALEMRHRRQEAGPGDESVTRPREGERLATLRSTSDAVQAALERPERAILH